jgi:hypothetical protein
MGPYFFYALDQSIETLLDAALSFWGLNILVVDLLDQLFHRFHVVIAVGLVASPVSRTT